MDFTALKNYISLCLVSVIVVGCAANHVALEESGKSGTVEVLVSSIGYDDNGLPIIGPALAGRPSRPGDRFSLVRLADGRPMISYDIAVVRQKPDFVKPLRTVYAWTGKGFKEGAAATGALSDVFTEDGSRVHVREVTVLELAIVVTPVTIGSVGGFVVGLADGIKQTALEMSKVVVNGEQAITCTTYDYDGFNRLGTMRMYTPDRARELVRTEFDYDDNGPVPFRTVVKSLVEGTVRTIKGR